MTAPPPSPDPDRPATAAASAALRPVVVTLRHRADFLRAAQARRFSTPGFTLQARERGAQERDFPLVRLGFTCSKKIGNAVIRNRAKRRLRELARAVLHGSARPGWDYVLVGRPAATVSLPYAGMLADLARAVERVHTAPPPRDGRPPGNPA